MELIQYFLSFLALICSASILVLELTVSPKVKRRTRLAAALSLVALIATFTVASLDRQSKARSEIAMNQRDIEQTQKTIAEIQRGLEKLERIRASAEVEVKPELVGLGLPAYQRRLEGLADRCLTDPANPEWIQETQPTVFRVTRTSECLPGSGEPLVKAALDSFHLTLELSMPEGRLQCGIESKPDLAAEPLASTAEDTLELQYNLRERTFILEASELEFDLLDAQRTGRILASGDLKKSLMRFGIWNSSLRPADARALAGGTQIRHLTVRFDSANPKIVDLDSTHLHAEPPGTGPTTPSYCVAPVDPE